MSNVDQSEPEVPYVSYTVNKPIGDSPKKVAGKTRGRFSSPRLSRAVNSKTKLASSAHNTLVTVNKAGGSSSDGKADIDLVRLAEIPSFVPIMQVRNQNTSIELFNHSEHTTRTSSTNQNHL